MGHAVSDVSHASDNMKGEVYYLESEPSDLTSQKATTTTLLCTSHDNSPTAEDTTTNAPSVINKNRIMDHCVQFLNGFELECVVSRCNVDVFCHGRVWGKLVRVVVAIVAVCSSTSWIGVEISRSWKG